MYVLQSRSALLALTLGSILAVAGVNTNALGQAEAEQPVRRTWEAGPNQPTGEVTTRFASPRVRAAPEYGPRISKKELTRLKTDLQAWWQDKSMVSNRQRLVEFYIEVVLKNIPDRIVIFIDEIQCIAGLPFAEHLLASIRAAHNSRLTDPEFKRLSFVLSGECDPQTLVSHDGLSPFNVSTQIRLADFSREELDIFKTQLNLSNA